MSVVVSIEGRDAIPVRAIPFVTGWKLSPDVLARCLAQLSDWPSHPQNMVGHHIMRDGRIAEMLPKEWDGIVSELQSVSDALHAEEVVEQSSYPEWRKQSIFVLPSHCFVWRDELEAECRVAWSRLIIVNERPGDKDLTFTPRIPKDLVGTVFEGFSDSYEAEQVQSQREQTAPQASEIEYDRQTALDDVARILSARLAKPRELAQAWVNKRWLDDGKILVLGERLRSLEICDLEKWIVGQVESGRLAAYSQSGIPAQERPKGSLAQGADWQDFMHVSLVQFRAVFEEMQAGIDIQGEPSAKPRAAGAVAAEVLSATVSGASQPVERLSEEGLADGGCGDGTERHEDEQSQPTYDLNHDKTFADLFDPVEVEQLEAMFPDNGKWAKYAERASRNGLITARVGRGKFNPYLAVRWWIDTQGPVGWRWEMCLRKLAKNLPARSRDSKHLLTGDFD